MYIAHPELKDTGESEYLDYLRWKYFWKDRVYCSDTTKNGSFGLIRDALNAYNSNYNFYHRSSSVYNNWHYMGPQGIPNNLQISGLISAVYVDTINDQSMSTIYVGTNSAGIWKTSDGGANWNNITDNSGYSIIGINDICGDPTNGNILFAATGGGFMNRDHGYGIGILKSSDGGVSWNIIYPDIQWPPTTSLNVYKIKVDPTNTQRIYALADNMLIRSLDGGNTWKKIFQMSICPLDQDTTLKRYLRDIELKPNDPTTLYIASDHRTPKNHRQSQVWKLSNVTDTAIGNITTQRLDTYFPSTVGNWSDTTIYTERYAIAVTPSEPGAIYVACTDYPENDYTKSQFLLWKFENNQWVLKIHSLNSDYYDIFGGCGYYKLELLVSTVEPNVVYVGGNSFDKIVSWNVTNANHTSYSGNGSNGFHCDTRCATFLKGTSLPNNNGSEDILFAGNDGGLSKTINGSHNWMNLNGNGLNITQFYGINNVNADPYLLIGGTQDNSGIRLTSTGWHHSGDGDLGKIVTNPINLKKSYSSFWGSGYLGLDTTNNFGSSWTPYQVDPNDSSAYCINGPVCLNPKKPSEVYFATHDLFISSNDGKHFVKKVINGSGILADQAARALRIAPSDTDRIYMAFDQPWWVWNKSRLFVTYDGGNNWSEVTTMNSNVSHYYGITDIEVSPTNADSIWISYGGFMDPSIVSSYKVRVYVSADSGQTWRNYSTGLPNVPVNCLTYKKGSHGGIFAGTDLGVFYIDRTFSDSTWIPVNNSLPVCVVNDVEYIDTIDAVRIATYGRGIWETDLHDCNYDGGNPLTINTDQTWVNETVMDRDIYITNSAVLTIRCKVKFPTDAKVMVEQGAELIVDGGILTNYCSGMWRGIEVWGDTSQRQVSMYQGTAFFTNGAIVENARIAVTACKKDINGDIIWSTPGGIIGAINTTFKNNYKAIEFLEYHHNQNCSFSNVDFISSGNFVDPNSHLSDFVSIFKSNGINFYGCRFQNQNLINSDTDSQYGRGIYSIDGGFHVDQYCISQQLPCTQWIPSEFNGLSYGIKSLGTVPTYPIYIYNSKFYKDHRGIYISGINNVAINRNTMIFNPVFSYSTYQSDTLYGLYLDNCSGYSIQENQLYRDKFQLNIRYIGMIINNSGPEPNEIYKNRIWGVSYAMLAQMQNRDSTGNSGLCFKCNNDSLTINDITAVNNKWGQYSNLYGIAANQGSLYYPAGNSFSAHHHPSYGDIWNEVTNAINYYYHDPNSTWRKIKPSEYSPDVYIHPTTVPYQDTTCPSKIENGGIGKESLMQQFSFEQTQLDSLKTVLNNLVDGGSTPILTTQVLNSIPSEADQLHQDLLSKSPYLSDTVVKSSILKENVLPNEMIRDILVANPASSKSENVLDQLNQRNIPMPDSLMAEIVASRDFLASKELLQANIATHGLKKAYALNELIRYFHSDTLSFSPKDSIISLLQNDPALESKYKLAFELLDKHDTMLIHNVLCSIPTSFYLKGHDSIVYQNYHAYFNILLALKSQNKSILDLNSGQKSQLIDIVSNGTEPIQTYARNILIANGLMDYCEPIILPNETKSQELPKSYKTSKMTTDRYMKLFPNPAKQYFIIEYNLQKRFGESPNIEFSLFTTEGKPLISKHVQKNQDQILIETRNFEQGTYICSMIVNSKIVDSEKILIIQ